MPRFLISALLLLLFVFVPARIQAQCFVGADSDKFTNSDQLISVDPVTGASFVVGPLGTLDLEAIVFSFGGSLLYGADGGQLGTIDTATGTFSALPASFGIGGGSTGDVLFSDVDSLAVNPLNGLLYGVHRTLGDGSPDLLFQIDTTTGAHRPDAWGPGIDYLEVAPLLDLESIDDLAIDADGRFFAIANDDATGFDDRLVLIDPITGLTADIGPIGVPDVEGLTFTDDGRLLASTGGSGPFGGRDKLLEIDLVTGAATLISALQSTFTDYEALACPGPALNTILGTVFRDDNTDALFNDPPPVSQSPVQVNLYLDTNADGLVDPGDLWVQTTFTDSSGAYAFQVGAANEFVLDIVPQDLPLGTVLTTDNLEGAIFTGSGEVDANNDFGYFAGATVGDRVWFDVDRDGIQDVGEPGLANVVVHLYVTGPDGLPGTPDDVLLETTRTSSQGIYLFSELPPDSYYTLVEASTLPMGLSLTPGSTSPSNTALLDYGDRVLDLDFGYAPNQNSIGDFVWSDGDADGLQDAGEAGLAGVTLDLLAAGADGLFGTADDTVVASTTTSNHGAYLFTGVPDGKFVVAITDVLVVLAGFSPTQGPQSEGGDLSLPVEVAGGSLEMGVDFGYTSPSLFTISDTLWFDADGDGLFDAEEKGIPNVTISLLDSDGNVIATTRTDSNGEFSFPGLPSGSYLLLVQDFANALDQTNPTTQPAFQGAFPIVLSGSDASGVNFGYNLPGSLGDTVFSDTDGDGEQDPGEPGLAGVSVELYLDANGDGLLDAIDTLLLTTTTDGAGQYLFTDLPAGTYFASIDDTQPALSGFSPTTTDGEPGFPGTQIEVMLASGNSFLDADFGYVHGALPNISGNVFHDLDLDGFDDGSDEPGFEQITLALIAAGPDGLFGTADDLIVSTTLTDPNGDYQFTDVPPGTYRVAIADDNGKLTDHFLTSGFDVLEINVLASDVDDLDFGYALDAAIGSIGDTVWLDANRDGLLGGAESGISGVRLELFDVGADRLPGTVDDLSLGTTTTDADGRYLFPGLPPGFYVVDVDETTLPGVLAPTVGTTDPSSLIALARGEAYPDADFGYASASGTALGDQIWFDLDGDGLQDPGEIGIGGVEVTVEGPSGTFVIFTEPDGSWLLTGLDPGLYTVTVNPATLPGGLDPMPTNGPISRMIPISTGFEAMHGDFGFTSGVFGSIGDTVFLDLDGDGLQGPGETGISGVTLDLLDGADNLIATTTTDLDGRYDFVGLGAGTFRVRVTDLAGALQDLNPTAGASTEISVVLGIGEDYNDADFPYRTAPNRGTIGNRVWHDENGDGLYDSGEPFFPRVTVDLWRDVDGDGVITPGLDNFLRTTTTDSNGEYFFTGLPAASYVVEVSDEHGILTGFTQTMGPSPGADNNSQADPYAIDLLPGLSDLTADFGFYSTLDLMIRGTTFEDVDRNATLAGGDIVEGSVRLFLFRDLDGDGEIDPGEPMIDQTLSAPDGTYQFANLPPGDYLVVAEAAGTALDGFEQTTQTLTRRIQPVRLTSGDSNDNDFGFFLPVTRVLLTDFSAHQIGNQRVIRWQTAAEDGTLGFELYAFDPTNQVLRPLHDNLLPAVPGAAQGAVYHLVDKTPDSLSYVLVELEFGGWRAVHGPFTVDLDDESMTDERRRLWPENGHFSARAREVPVPPEIVSRQVSMEVVEAQKSEPPTKIEIAIDEPGLYRLSAFDIAEALEMPLDEVRQRLQLHQLKLTYQWGNIPWKTDRSASGLLFYARPWRHTYSPWDVFILEVGPGLSMPTIRGTRPSITTDQPDPFITELAFEEDVVPVTALPIEPEAGIWFWRGFLAGDPDLGSHTFRFDIDAPVDLQEDAVLTLYLQGASNPAARSTEPDHPVAISINGTPLAELAWEDLEAHRVEIRFRQDILEEKNQLQLTALPSLNGVNAFYLDRFSLRFRQQGQATEDHLELISQQSGLVTLDGFGSGRIHVVDVTNPSQPREVTALSITRQRDRFRVTFKQQDGHRYWIGSEVALRHPIHLRAFAEADLGHSRHTAEYLILTSRELFTAASRLADHRAGQGLTTKVIESDSIYREFAAGRRSPEAIRDFLRIATQNWAQPPRFVVLFGAGHFDYANNLESSGVQHLPPLLVQTPNGLFASDQSLADVDEDLEAELMIGRIPVRTPDEAEAFVDKLITYENSHPGDWSDDVLLIADDDDQAGFFARDSERASSFLPESTNLQRIYLEADFTDTQDQSRRDLLTRWNLGAGLVNYLGHGGFDTLAESLLMTADVPTLTNGQRLPFFSALSCSVGRFEIPGFECLACALVRHPEGGAIASLAATGPSYQPDAKLLNEEIFKHLGRDTPTIGEALQAALSAYRHKARYPQLLQVYTFFGDPATRTVSSW